MKRLPQLTRADLTSLGFCTSLELAGGAVLTAMLIRWITL